MANDSPRTTAGELQNIVESRGQKNLQKNGQTAPTSPHVVLSRTPCLRKNLGLCHSEI